MLKRKLKFLGILIVCASLIYPIMFFLKSFPLRYLYLICIYVLVLGSGPTVFHYMIKKKYSKNLPLTKTLEFIFYAIWFFLTFYFFFYFLLPEDFLENIL